MATSKSVAESIEAWQGTLAIGGEQATRIKSLVAAINGGDRLETVRCFIGYVNSATKYRTLWIQYIAGVMRALDAAGAKRRFEDPNFDTTDDGFFWIEQQCHRNQKRFEERIDKWVPQVPQCLAMLHAANAAFISKGLTDLPADLGRLIRQVRSKGSSAQLPSSICALEASIQAGECTIAALGVPTQQVMAWPLKADSFPKDLTVKEAKKYLLVRHSLKISERTLSDRAKKFPTIKLGGKYDRDGIDAAAVAGHFLHKNLNQHRG